MKSKYDIIVVGGGTAGLVAAIQAGRAGASVLLVGKKTPWSACKNFHLRFAESADRIGQNQKVHR